MSLVTALIFLFAGWGFPEENAGPTRRLKGGNFDTAMRLEVPRRPRCSQVKDIDRKELQRALQSFRITPERSDFSPLVQAMRAENPLAEFLSHLNTPPWWCCPGGQQRGAAHCSCATLSRTLGTASTGSSKPTQTLGRKGCAGYRCFAFTSAQTGSWMR